MAQRCLSESRARPASARLPLLTGLMCLGVFGIVEASYDRVYPLPAAEQQVVGEVEGRVLRYEDTFARVAREAGVGFTALQNANAEVDPWIPGEGTQIVLPTAYLLPDAPREGIIINLSERRLFYFDKQRNKLSVFPVGIGREGYDTPAVLTKTVTRIENPSWTPPESVRREHAERGDILPRVVPPGPDNPLGKYAIQLATPGYFLHGTNHPFGVGQRVSHGCIRLYPAHIESLVSGLPNGTQVRIVRQPHKVGWHDGVLYLESHPEQEADGTRDATAAMRLIVAATKVTPVEVDWDLATQVAITASGIPTRISR